MNQTKPIFSIKNLRCQYQPNHPVLDIEKLTIGEGKLIFILGVSGVGKSTFIETLGLMNNTIKQQKKTHLSFYPKNTQAIELKKYWSKADKELSSFRNQYFSFIFQNTNLMPNFTAGENMCISQLIKGISLQKAKRKVLQVMRQLQLPSDIFDKKITALSGGQRQRLAFVRAITSSFTVLFGDEPTGNLDRNTAYILMNILRQNLEKYQRTGIIVSHDIDLALKFADEIVMITPHMTPKNRIIGKILEKNILYKKGEIWGNLEGDLITSPEDYLFKHFQMQTDVEKIVRARY